MLSGHKRAAVGYGSYDPYSRNNIGGMFNRRSGGWRSNSRFNGGWNQYGELLNSTGYFSLFSNISQITMQLRKLLVYA